MIFSNCRGEYCLILQEPKKYFKKNDCTIGGLKLFFSLNETSISDLKRSEDASHDKNLRYQIIEQADVGNSAHITD